MPSEEIRIDCDEPQQIVAAFNKAITQLDADERRSLSEVFSQYLREGGLEMLFNCLNHRTVRQILNEFSPAADKPIATGELNGISFKLYDGRDSNRKASND